MIWQACSLGAERSRPHNDYAILIPRRIHLHGELPYSLYELISCGNGAHLNSVHYGIWASGTGPILVADYQEPESE